MKVVRNAFLNKSSTPEETIQTLIRFAEIARQWKMEPTIWETPHYTGDANTYRAALESGFLYFTEADTKLFPNRHGYLNRAAGRLLNIPETAFDYPDEPGATNKAGRLKQQRLLPRIARMNGLFLFFYPHSFF